MSNQNELPIDLSVKQPDISTVFQPTASYNMYRLRLEYYKLVEHFERHQSLLYALSNQPTLLNSNLETLINNRFLNFQQSNFLNTATAAAISEQSINIASINNCESSINSLLRQTCETLNNQEENPVNLSNQKFKHQFEKIISSCIHIESGNNDCNNNNIDLQTAINNNEKENNINNNLCNLNKCNNNIITQSQSTNEVSSNNNNQFVNITRSESCISYSSTDDSSPKSVRSSSSLPCVVSSIPSTSSAATSSMQSSFVDASAVNCHNNNNNNKKKLIRSLTGKHVRQGTGAKIATLQKLRCYLEKRLPAQKASS